MFSVRINYLQISEGKFEENTTIRECKVSEGKVKGSSEFENAKCGTVLRAATQRSATNCSFLTVHMYISNNFVKYSGRNKGAIIQFSKGY